MIRRIMTALISLIMMMPGVVMAESTNAASIEAPQSLTAELKQYDDGMPYFQLIVGVPASVMSLGQNEEEQNASLFYEVEYKVGNGNWAPTGAVHFALGTHIIINPDDMGLNGNVDIKANTYSFRVKFGYYLYSDEDENGNKTALEQVFSPFSKTASIGIDAYRKVYEGASSWATAELDKAAEYGFVTDKINGKMSAPITREELCEVIMKMYEKMIGKAGYSNLTAFSDTNNPEVYKAYELGITDGVGEGKFAPKDLTNREQVAAMMHRVVKAIKPGTDFSTAGAETFADEKLISAWALESVRFMSKNGFIQGSNGSVDPKGTTTREQAVLIILRIYEKYNK